MKYKCMVMTIRTVCRYHNTDTTIQIPQYKYQTIIDEKTNNDSQNTTDMSSYKLVVAKA